MKHEPDIKFKFRKLYASVDSEVLTALHAEVSGKKNKTAGERQLLPYLVAELKNRGLYEYS